ncbi:glycosyltransferase [Tistrella mobilis]|uniref:glycosyltransferase n=1 Tax=Tistrella mobilis TaxID=171437 RepID=UPI0035577CA0
MTSASHGQQPTIAVVLKGYPRLSETFIAQEIRALEMAGLPLRLVSLRHPTDARVHPVHREITAGVRYLPEYLHQEPFRLLRGLRRAARLPGFARARDVWLRDLARDRTRNRIRRFGQAAVLAAELEDDVAMIYAHFLHTPASVARYAAIMRGLPWSVSAHAKDIWTSPDWEKAEKLADCAWAVTCTATNRDHLASLAPDGRVQLLYHGLDLSRFPDPGPQPAGSQPAGPDGTDPARPVILVGVGRLVEKKGWDTVLDALALLPADLAWRFVHIGGGPLKDRLKDQAARLGLADRIDWLGARAQAEVIEAYGRADLFVLASRIAGDGDRDGLPNVLMEAQSQRLAVVATRVSAIPEFIDDGENGRLVAPDDAAGLSAALASLIRDPARRAAMGAAGRRRLEGAFSLTGSVGPLIDRLRAAVAARGGR